MKTIFTEYTDVRGRRANRLKVWASIQGEKTTVDVLQAEIGSQNPNHENKHFLSGLLLVIDKAWSCGK